MMANVTSLEAGLISILHSFWFHYYNNERTDPNVLFLVMQVAELLAQDMKWSLDCADLLLFSFFCSFGNIVFGL